MRILAKGSGPVPASLAMAEFFQSPLVSVVLLLALAAAMVAVGAYVIGKVRAGLRREDPDSSEWLTRFKELHAHGKLSDEEFQSIKTMLAERLQHELNDTDAPG